MMWLGLVEERALEVRLRKWNTALNLQREKEAFNQRSAAPLITIELKQEEIHSIKSTKFIHKKRDEMEFLEKSSFDMVICHSHINL